MSEVKGINLGLCFYCSTKPEIVKKRSDFMVSKEYYFVSCQNQMCSRSDTHYCGNTEEEAITSWEENNVDAGHTIVSDVLIDTNNDIAMLIIMKANNIRVFSHSRDSSFDSKVAFLERCIKDVFVRL